MKKTRKAKDLLHQCTICWKMVNDGHEDVVHLQDEDRSEEYYQRELKIADDRWKEAERKLAEYEGEGALRDFAESSKDDPQKIIEWAESEIREYKKLVAILKKRI